jgi:hypothetical protein
MISLSSTGIAYLLLFFSTGLLTYRFFQYWKEKKDTTSKLFLFFGATFAVFALVRTISVFFFAGNIQILLDSIIFVAFIESFAAAIVAYLIIHLKFPNISPWLGFGVIFLLGLLTTVLTTNISYQPSIGDAGAINWGFLASGAGVFYSILRLGIILITFIPLIIVLIQQFKASDDLIVKKKSFGLSLVLIMGITVGFIDFILTDLLKLNAFYRDITVGVLSIFLFIIIFTTQKPTTSKTSKTE